MISVVKRVIMSSTILDELEHLRQSLENPDKPIKYGVPNAKEFIHDYGHALDTAEVHVPRMTRLKKLHRCRIA